MKSKYFMAYIGFVLRRVNDGGFTEDEGMSKITEIVDDSKEWDMLKSTGLKYTNDYKKEPDDHGCKNP